MFNDKKTITPNEINKFTYCPYQWYYERYYGSKGIRNSVNVKKINLTPKVKKTSVKTKTINSKKNETLKNFKRGNNFHQRQYISYKRNTLLLKVVFIILVIFFIYFCLRSSFNGILHFK